ncbi:hypothetical protein EVAR_7996_1 [Eumeta japonica]|uniref:Uncharacterized protein n=1 Tax=Eumeta variegata TaxID=151549 RepID=A0A4C1THU1_EUMVA|nr:hypothetical protein EVAR_7996_1 [Eumeta japonica]
MEKDTNNTDGNTKRNTNALDKRANPRAPLVRHGWVVVVKAHFHPLLDKFPRSRLSRDNGASIRPLNPAPCFLLRPTRSCLWSERCSRDGHKVALLN